MHEHNAILIGISGVSSSGKTTLARLLRDIFPNTFVLHEDDFYKTDADIPINKEAGNVADWDCLEAIDLPALASALNFIKVNGMPPPDLVSKEDKNDVGPCEVDRKAVDRLEWQASRWMFQDVPPIAIIDGFLLYAEGMKQIRELFDVRVLLRTNFATGKARRENRQGYVTVEGFWEDPPNCELAIDSFDTFHLLTIGYNFRLGERRVAKLCQRPCIPIQRRQRRGRVRRRCGE
jgi:nicotinamide/nicotinate riboside kinase